MQEEEEKPPEYTPSSGFLIPLAIYAIYYAIKEIV